MAASTTSAAATERSVPLIDSSSEYRWRLATLFGFRTVCAYFLLQWVPLVVTFTTASLTLGLVPDPNWWGSLNIAFGRWTITHLFVLPEHSPPRLSANSLPLFLGMVGVAVISLVVAALWSAFDRRSSYPRLFTWLHTFTRFMLVAVMLGYGWAKVLPDQFAVSLDYFALAVGQHNPRDLLWAFMTGSRGYQVFTGVVEVAGALLLLTRRTVMIGALISVAALANVLALDISYDVPVKFLAGQMFLMSIFVLAPYVTRLVALSDLNRGIPPASGRRLIDRTSADHAVRTAGVVLGLWIVGTTLQDVRNEVMAKDRDRQTSLYGVWDVEEVSRNGVSVPLLLTDSTLWRRLVVQSSNAAVIFPMSEFASSSPWTGRSSAVRYSIQVDNTAHTVEFAPFPFSATTERLSFGYLVSDADHLVLTRRNGVGSTTAVRLRRFDLSMYPLVKWERHWSW